MDPLTTLLCLAIVSSFATGVGITIFIGWIIRQIIQIGKAEKERP